MIIIYYTSAILGRSCNRDRRAICTQSDNNIIDYSGKLSYIILTLTKYSLKFMKGTIIISFRIRNAQTQLFIVELPALSMS